MVTVTHKIQDLNFSQDMLNVLQEIDNKLVKITKKKLDSIRYAGKFSSSLDDFDRLSKYRKILELKLMNVCCLKDYQLDSLVSRTKQILNRN